MPQISIIIPVFNRKELIRRALQSVLNQTFSDFEIIIIDDGSTDNLSLEELMNQDQRISCYRLPYRSGVSKARNEGVLKSSGKWIAFLDSDDEWLKSKLSKQIKWTITNPGFEIVQTKEIWVRNGLRVNPPLTHEKFGGDLFEASLERCMITPSSVLLTRSLFDRIGGFNESLPACEDYDLWLRICSSHYVGLIDEFLLTRYGGHQDQLSSTVMGLDRFRIRSLLQLLEHNQLNNNQRALAISMLVKKATVVANGYLKRGNTELYERFISIVAKYGAK